MLPTHNEFAPSLQQRGDTAVIWARRIQFGLAGSWRLHEGALSDLCLPLPLPDDILQTFPGLQGQVADPFTLCSDHGARNLSGASPFRDHV